MTISIKRVFPTDERVMSLIDKLNTYQISLYGVERCNLESPQSLVQNKALMLGAYDGQTLVGIGAIKLADSYGEIKRMYVEEAYRGSSIAENILRHLEEYARQKGMLRICLETGNKHHQALRFYQKQGYSQIERFGDYSPNQVSMYFEKTVSSTLQ
ncbi:GNAT family N-acetyltransferase [Rhodocytophaga aerolata]|uniref:GNAT family N-acetyltransferase n=1 Tax=Rhodocytophaga aerolata TaxID=455078 RepID=A0ABT8RI39_9BACT|nr:GNAT family N-acetyltransferase [Rhodocytophaga aerolata]MDO1451772.1 GNAT family N-acetyltransferase [Rhodocytophaga aerolata]